MHYTRSPDGLYTVTSRHGEKFTGYQRDDVLRLAYQSDRRREQRQAIATNLAKREGARRLSWM